LRFTPTKTFPVERFQRESAPISTAPAGGSAAALPDTDDKRQALNAWIREQSPADPVVDFDAAVRDPADPSRINPIYDGFICISISRATRRWATPSRLGSSTILRDLEPVSGRFNGVR
jgi:hypothetical protein